MDGVQNGWVWWGEILPALDISSDKLNKAKIKTNPITNSTQLTVLEYSFHIEAIGSTCFIVRAPFEIIGQLSRPTVVYHPWVALIDCI